MGTANFYPLLGVILFVVVIYIIFFAFRKNKTQSDSSSVESSIVTKDNVQVQKSNEDLSDDELIAVLTAAVMSMQSNSNIKLRVTSFRRIPQSSPVWNTTGRIERLEDKL